MEDHRKRITSEIRKNNIFGERQDYIIREFLDVGGEAAFYSPKDNSILFGRTGSKLYVILLLPMDTPGNAAGLDPTMREALQYTASAMGGVPIYGLNKTYCKAIKWFDIDGNTLKSL